MGKKEWDFLEKIKPALAKAHAEMLANPFHSLLPKQRLPIYYSISYEIEIFEPLISIFWGCLAIVTARKVLLVWEEEMPGDNLGQRILEVSEGLLVGKLTNIETQQERGSFQRAVGNSEQFVESDRARAALFAAFSALKAISGYAPFQKLNKKQIENGLPDEIIADIWGDTAGLAVLAYSGFTYKRGVLSEGTYVYSRGKIDIVSKKKPSALLKTPKDFLKKIVFKGKQEEMVDFHRLGLTINEEFDPKIRKEFWEWWLYEAIPKAWDLSQRIAEGTGKKDKNGMPLEF